MLDDLLQLHYERDGLIDSRKSYCFYKIVLHKQVRHFAAESHSLPLSFWTCLFDGHFQHLLVLNLEYSCCDALLKVVAEQCPKLEVIHATCRYERVQNAGNATTFTMSVTDVGIGYLVKCQALRQVMISEARSQRKGRDSTITHKGIRQMLRDLPRLEDVTYSDLGAVLAKNMEDVPELNLTMVRHYNATPESLREILRLCPRLRYAQLIFFVSTGLPETMIDALLENQLSEIKALELENLNFGSKWLPFLLKFGPQLEFLSILSNYQTMDGDELVLIGRHCPHLTHLRLGHLTNSRLLAFRPPPNFGQFSCLEYLDLKGDYLDLKPILLFCTTNATHLQYLSIYERKHQIAGDPIFVHWIHPLEIRKILCSENILFSWMCVGKLVEVYKKLEYMVVFCENLIAPNGSSSVKFTLTNKNRMLTMEMAEP